MGQYATGQALLEAGAVLTGDMTLEAFACKCAYLFERQDVNMGQVMELMSASLGEKRLLMKYCHRQVVLARSSNVLPRREGCLYRFFSYKVAKLSNAEYLLQTKSTIDDFLSVL